MAKKSVVKLLEKSPNYNKKDIYLWTDYYELLCMINPDGVLSQKDFIDRIAPRVKDLGEGDIEEIENESRLSNAENNDVYENFADDCFNMINYRSLRFKEYYPFVIDDNIKLISLNKILSEEQKIYLFLLFCSSLNYCSAYNTSLTSSFERVCLEVMKSFLPSHGECFLFGSSNIENNTDSTIRGTLFWDKLEELVALLGEKNLKEKSDFSKFNKGDGGLDIVGITNLGDSCTHFPIFFGQCACTPEEWVNKQNSCKSDHWRNYMTLSISPISFIFIPFSFRSSNGNWFEPYKIHSTVLVDRERLIHNFKREAHLFKSLSSYSIVNEISNLKESVV